MANEEHLAILRQGVEVWNAWRRENPNVKPDLEDANLKESDLSGANLKEADLEWADLGFADLQKVDLSESDLSGVDFYYADLSGANLSGANLQWAKMQWVNLQGSDLIDAVLEEIDFQGANLQGVDLHGARITRVIFADVDLRLVQNLDKIEHVGPSTIGIDTLYKSQGQIPEVFLRGCGVPDSMIEYARSLVAAERPIDYYSCFICYSSKDEMLAERLYADLQARGVRCWYAPHDMQIGEPILSGIDRGIRLHDKLLLILSEASVESGWVEQEVHMALAREKTERRRVLFPIRIDDTVIESRQGWPAILRDTIHIGDFRQWKQHDVYQSAFARLLRDLKAEQV